MRTNDYVLVMSRNDHIGDIIYKYDKSESYKLYLYKEIPESIKNKYRSLHNNENVNETINDIIFTDEVIDDDDDINNI